MDKLIQSGLQPAQFDSSGRFSIDVRQAFAKGIRLADPEEFVLLLVSWATQSGASKVVIRLSGGQIEVAHNGQAPSLDQLDRLMQNFVPGSNAANQSLALAVMGALQTTPRKLILEVSEGSWTPYRLRRRATGKNFVVRVQLPIFQRFRRVESILRKHCLHSTIEIEFNRRILNRAYDLSDNLASLALRSGQAPLPSYLPAAQHQDREWEEDYSLLLGTDQGDFETQIYGVASHRLAHRGLVVGSRFSLDAGLLRAVDDPQRSARVDGSWLELAERALLQPTSDLDRLGRLQEEVIDWLLAQGNVERAHSLLLERLALAGQRCEDKVPWLQRLARLDQQCSRYDRALVFWQEAYQLRREPVSAEGILACLRQAPPAPPGYREPLQTLLRASRKSDQLEPLCDWLWTGQQWEEALECHREWLTTLKAPAQRAHCLRRLAELAERLGRKLEEENYRIQIKDWLRP